MHSETLATSQKRNLMEVIMTSALFQTQVQIPIADLLLVGDLILPKDPKGIVLFVHGSGSSRHSSRNQYIARILQQLE
jgi:hypothetical protein